MKTTDYVIYLFSKLCLLKIRIKVENSNNKREGGKLKQAIDLAICILNKNEINELSCLLLFVLRVVKSDRKCLSGKHKR